MEPIPDLTVVYAAGDRQPPIIWVELLNGLARRQRIEPQFSSASLSFSTLPMRFAPPRLFSLLALGLIMNLATPAVARSPLPSVTAPSAWSSFPAPKTSAPPLNLWATFYHIYRAPAIAQGYALLNNAGDRLGPKLSQRDWCKAALQGTVQILKGQTLTTYNFSGRGGSPQVNCAPFFSSLSSTTLAKVSRVRFSAVAAPYGLGTNNLHLVPYRTIAVDRRRIPIGSVVFIPAARGVPVMLPSGDRVIHDGYFFAADVGSAIRDNHIDVFIGTDERSPFDFITSKSSGRFPAYIVRDTAIGQQLATLHR